MRLVLVADAFPPMRSSASIQLWDLAVEIKRLGHDIWVLVPSSDISQSSVFEEMDGINVLRLKAHKTKDIGYIKRAVNEFLMPFLMIKNYRASQVKDFKWDGVIWYSPTIFLGLVAWYLKKKSECKAYLILRDIFPKWALDLGLIKKGPSYLFLSAVEYFQYWIADVIGIQSKADLMNMVQWVRQKRRKVELLENWLEDRQNLGSVININSTSLAGRSILVYAGNMGIAQDASRLVKLAVHLKDCPQIGFLFIGRGDQAESLREVATSNYLKNILFYDEIEPDQIPGLLSQCTVGLIALDSRHKTSNIPGKFISYMQSGLPVLALVNDGNELLSIIERYNVGIALTNLNLLDIIKLKNWIISISRSDSYKNGRFLYEKRFSSKIAAQKILQSLAL